MFAKIKNFFLSPKFFGFLFLILSYFVAIPAILNHDIRAYLLSLILCGVTILLLIIPKRMLNNPMVLIAWFLCILPFVFAFLVVSFASDRIIWFTAIRSDQWVNIFGSILTYYGAIILGTVSIWQNNRLQLSNKKLQESNEKYQKLSIAQFLSFMNVSSPSFSICKNDRYEQFYKRIDKIELKDKSITDPSSQSYFIFDFMANNSSEYTITSLKINFEMPKRAYCLKNSTLIPIYIESKGTKALCIAVAIDKESEDYWKNNDTYIKVKVYTTNVFQFTTLGVFTISKSKDKPIVNYQIAQFSDINVFDKGQKAED